MAETMKEANQNPMSVVTAESYSHSIIQNEMKLWIVWQRVKPLHMICKLSVERICSDVDSYGN